MSTKNSREARAPLSKEAVLQAAIRLADEEGIASLSMRKLAETFGVKAMSLYYHVANKDELLGGMVDSVFSEIELPASGDDWKTSMRRRAASAREALLRHGWALSLMDSRPNPGPATLAHHNAVIGSLRRGGFSVTATAHAFSLLDSYIYGFVLQELSLAFTTTEELGEGAENILGQVPATEYPYFTEMATEYALKPGYVFGNGFDFGLGLILEGLERVRLEQT